MNAVARWLGYENVEITSPLAPEECAQLLRDAVEGGALANTAPVVGQVDETSFRLRKRLPATSHNSFQTYMTGSMTADGGSTRVACRTGMHPFVIGFVALWFVMLLAIALVWLMLGVAKDGFAPALAIFPVMAIFCVGLIVFARRFAGGEKDFLLAFLRDTIKARETGTSATETAKTVERRR